MTTYLKFTVLEDGKHFSVGHMTEPESAAIEECVNGLVPSECEWRTDYWLEVDMCPSLDEEFRDDDADEEPNYGLLRCFAHNPNPKNSSQLESRIPHPLPKEVLEELAGKTIRVYPRQLGVNPWGSKVEIVFEPHVTAPIKSGIKASALIAAALKQ